MAEIAVDQKSLLKRRGRTHAIVEGALLGDIAIVFLLMRVYLPLPVVRTLIRTVATIPFVMLVQRRGAKLTILAAIASYILFSALVGPLLALTALDIAVAGLLAGIGRHAGLNVGWNTLLTGPVYAILDLVIPTILSIYILRFPIKQLVQSARHFVELLFRAANWVLTGLNAPASVIHQVHSWEQPAVDHWQFIWLGISILYGLMNMYLVVLVAEMVLHQLPKHMLARQQAE